MEKENRTISRRGFVAGAAAAGVLAAGSSMLTGCGGGGEAGGTFRYYINEPAWIDPYNLQESEGTAVTSNIFDSLLEYDYRTEKLNPAAAESWEVSDDATVFTFKLRSAATFHNGDPVTAKDFKFAWERICNPTTAAEPSEISYHLAMVKGYSEMISGKAKDLVGAVAKDDLTFEVTLIQPYADFIYVITHPALGPVPSGGAAANFATYSQAPIGNGPFMIEGKWEHNQYIQVKRFENYYGDKALLDGVDFNIISEVDTAFTEFKAGNLDFVQIASGQIDTTLKDYGESADGFVANPGKQTLLGPESSTYYLNVNTLDPVMKDKNVRMALSYAINRQAICDAVFFGTRVPATGIIPPGIKGFRDGAWPASTYDVEKAKKALADAGYPNGEGFPTIKLSFNTGGDHGNIMQMVQADFRAIGVTAELDSMEWGLYLDELAANRIQIGRLGWIADYPIMENFLYSLFYTGTGDNYSNYSNKQVDEAIYAARGETNDNDRIKAFQNVDDMIAADFPIIPIMFYRHTRVASSRVNNFYFGPTMLPDLTHTWLTQ
ncbi:MAG: peptide ABC transporter substrate-binding protein [Coriobacteriales bacterium]|jgi:peptide/nickel transport system substrate-binding protein/oligopeptide transport system substrate-binding protein|nr:peptide ABC transporter substrate-binding protein [Coriobacteriales bacterium]